jgi:hypothetical protein
VSPNLSIVRPPSTQPMLEHPLSSALSLLLLPRSSSLPAMPHLSPTHHETSKCVSQHETDSRVEPPKFCGFKFKPRQVNCLSQIKPRTNCFLNLPLDEYIDNTKAQSLNLNPRPHEAQPEGQKAKKSSIRSSKRRKNRKTNKW